MRGGVRGGGTLFWAAALTVAACSGGDAGTDDAGPADAPDAASGDAGFEDAGTADAAARDAGPRCEAPEAWCGGACVDTRTSAEHCGDCNVTCEPGRVCRAGDCACPVTQQLCDGRCVDTFTSTEQCGDCNRSCEDGQVCLVGVCHAPPPDVPRSVAPRLIGRGCSTGEAQADAVAVDAARTIYVAMRCGSETRVAVSEDGALTFSPARSVGFADAVDVAIAAHAPGEVHAVAHTEGGALVYAASADGGETWSAPRVLDPGPVDSAFFSLRANLLVWRGHVLTVVMDGAGTTARVLRGVEAGGDAQVNEIAFGAYGGNLTVDPATGALWLLLDRPSQISAYRSLDLGATFAPAFTLPDLGVAAEYALAPPYLYTACSIGADPERARCAARVTLETQAIEDLDVPLQYSFPVALGYGSVTGLGDGSAAYAVSRGQTQADRDGLAVGRAEPGRAALVVRELAEQTFLQDTIPNSVDVAGVPGLPAAAVVFTAPDGVRAAVERF